MKRQITLILFALSVVTLLLGGVNFVRNGRTQHAGLLPTAHAQEQESVLARAQQFPRRPSCTLGTIQGSYGFSAQGTIVPNPALPPNVPTGPYASQGVVTLDGFGNLSSLVNDNFNGLVVPTAPNTGKYTVNDNCSGSVTLANGAVYNFSIVEGGREILFSLGVPGVVVTGVAKRL